MYIFKNIVSPLNLRLLGHLGVNRTTPRFLTQPFWVNIFCPLRSSQIVATSQMYRLVLFSNRDDELNICHEGNWDRFLPIPCVTTVRYNVEKGYEGPQPFFIISMLTCISLRTRKSRAEKGDVVHMVESHLFYITCMWEKRKVLISRFNINQILIQMPCKNATEGICYFN